MIPSMSPLKIEIFVNNWSFAHLDDLPIFLLYKGMYKFTALPRASNTKQNITLIWRVADFLGHKNGDKVFIFFHIPLQVDFVSFSYKLRCWIGIAYFNKPLTLNFKLTLMFSNCTLSFLGAEGSVAPSRLPLLKF